MSTLIEFDGVCKYYQMGDTLVKAADHVSFKINKGEFVAIVGQSGSGKSTCMNIIGCLDVPTEGTYLLDGRDVGKMSRRELANIRNEKLGFIFQQYNLLPKLTLLENVEVPLVYAGIPAAQRHATAKAALERVGLGNKLKNLPNQLSGGQQQRVSIARALARGPAVILADEPTGALDSHTSREVLGMLQDLHKQGNTVVLITHDNSIAVQAERIIHYDRRRVTRLEFQNMHVSGDMKTLAISHATCSTSADLGAKCIVAFTESGSTARAVSTYRPGTLIVAATPCEQTFNRLSMSWGVKPVLVAKRPSSGTELYSLSEQAAIQTLDLRVGDIITITAGMPVGHVNYTNTLRVHQLTELSFAPFVQD